ncbi:MAG: efflux RND transporter periplasmic adaptor subunit [Acidobacteria bacterium]|nr:efflux RND transporter periplasmic adaptor subunit [Acidobacteriota bacterium]
MRFSIAIVLAPVLVLAGCSRETKAAPTKAEVTLEPGVYHPAHPELFKLVTVESRDLPTVLHANGSVTPDVNRTIHVTSQGSGRVMDLRVKLGDHVSKGQVLLSIYSADLASAFSDYQKAVADERLSKRALDRAQLLFSKGALAQKDLEVAQDTEDKAQVDVQNTLDHVRLLGGNPDHPSAVIELRAPVSGTIVEQNVAGSEGVKSLDNSPNLFTIADLSQVWILCDVYENDLGEVHLADPADIRLNAYPDKNYHGRVVDISRVLDPNIRAAKVRIVLSNRDGSLRPGMFAVATFHSRKLLPKIVVPSDAIMRLQDKDWVFRKEGASTFRRLEVHALALNEGSISEVEGGVRPGEQLISNALEFSTAMAEQGK